MIYRNLFRPMLFTQDPEAAHERTLGILSNAQTAGRWLARHPLTHDRLRVTLAGLHFPNPVGLAAGCDKNGLALTVWPGFGFGFVEIGTVTAQPQPGNPKPRLFRIPEHHAIINRLGFNSEGSEVVARRLARIRCRAQRLPIPIGINIGKTKVVTETSAVLEDYLLSLRRLAPFADYIVVNVSSPNTPGLRQWQERERLSLLLTTLMAEVRNRGYTTPGTEEKPLPVFVKISPDMADADMIDVLEVVHERGLSGIIATNTTLGRSEALAQAGQEGGLSGSPLNTRANEVIRFLARNVNGKIPLIGVGGIRSAEDAYERIRSGASLIQFYTAMIYEGPYLARRINRGLLKLMERDGVRSIEEAVGVEA